LVFDFLESDTFVIGYYVVTVAASLALVRQTKQRLKDFKIGIGSIKFAPIAFGMLLAYIFLAYDYVDTIPILNWSWLGYNIAFGPFADQGVWGIIPFIPLLVYMFIHINYIEELYFRKSKKDGCCLGFNAHSYGREGPHGNYVVTDRIFVQIHLR